MGTKIETRTKMGENNTDDTKGVEELVYAPRAYDLLNCMMGRHDECVDDIDAEIVEIVDNPAMEFDVEVEVKCAGPIRVVDSRSLGQYDVENVQFHSLEPVEDGMVMSVSAEYYNDEYGFSIMFTCGE